MTQTLIELQDRRALYLAAEARILEGQAYRISTGGGERQLTRADLATVQAEIRRLDAQIATLTARTRGRRMAYMVPRG